MSEKLPELGCTGSRAVLMRLRVREAAGLNGGEHHPEIARVSRGGLFSCPEIHKRMQCTAQSKRTGGSRLIQTWIFRIPG